MSSNFTQQPQLYPSPNLEPPGFDLLRDLLTRKFFSLESNPYNFDPAMGVSPQQLFNPAGRGTFNPYQGGYGPGGPTAPPMGAGGGGAQLTGGQIPQEGMNSPMGGGGGGGASAQQLISGLSNAFSRPIGQDSIGSPPPMNGPQPGGLPRPPSAGPHHPSMPGVMLPTSHHPFGARGGIHGGAPNHLAVIHALMARLHGGGGGGMMQPQFGASPMMLGHDGPSVNFTPTESPNQASGPSWNPQVGQRLGGLTGTLPPEGNNNVGGGVNAGLSSIDPYASMLTGNGVSSGPSAPWRANNVGAGGLSGVMQAMGGLGNYNPNTSNNLPGFGAYTGAQHEWGGNPAIAQGSFNAGQTPGQVAQWTMHGMLGNNPGWNPNGVTQFRSGQIGAQNGAQTPWSNWDGQRIGYDSPYMFQRGPQAPLGMDSIFGGGQGNNNWGSFGGEGNNNPNGNPGGGNISNNMMPPQNPGGGSPTPTANIYGGNSNPMNFGQPMSPWLMPYQGGFTAPMSPYEQGALGGYTNFLSGGLGLQPGSNYYNNELGGQYLNLNSNPYLQQIQGGMQGMKNYNDQQAMNQIGSSMAAGGNALGGARLGAMSDYMRNSNNQFQSTMGQLMNQNYLNERGLMNQAPGGLANLANTIGSAYGQEFGMGALPRSLQQNDLNAQYQDFLRQGQGMYGAAQTPDQQIMQYLQSGRYSGQYQPLYGSSQLDQIAGLLGGNSGLGSLLGSGLGSLLGLLGGGGGSGSGGTTDQNTTSGQDGRMVGYDGRMFLGHDSPAPGTTGPANYYDKNWYNNALTTSELNRAQQMQQQAQGPNTTLPAILTILASILGNSQRGRQGGGLGAPAMGGGGSGGSGGLLDKLFGGNKNTGPTANPNMYPSPIGPMIPPGGPGNVQNPYGTDNPNLQGPYMPAPVPGDPNFIGPVQPDPNAGGDGGGGGGQDFGGGGGGGESFFDARRY